MWPNQEHALQHSILFILLVFALPEIHARLDSVVRKRVQHVPANPPPTFRVYTNDVDFPDVTATGARIQEAWLDMWHLAAVACVTLDEEEDVYERYFEPGESEMVQRRSCFPDCFFEFDCLILRSEIFCNIAGIENPEKCDITTMNPITNVHMQDLTIVAGLATPNEIPSSEQPDLINPDLELFATTFQDRGPGDTKAFTQLYKRAFDYPSLKDILTKRTCDGLGPYDSGLMTSLGAHLLHEMVHWRLLVRDVNNEERFDAVITHTVLLPDPDDSDKLEEEERDYIDDYNKDEYEDPDIDPVTGYGPANAHELVINGNDVSFRNADNYRWYAVSKYWSWKCTQVANGQNIVFGQQNNNDFGDGIVPKDCDGQIPCA